MTARSDEPYSWLTAGIPHMQEGWPAVDGEPAEGEAEAREAAMLAEFERARLVHDVFATGRGPELFEALRETLIERPVVRVVGSVGHEQIDMAMTPEQWLWIRAGQNSVFFWLRDLLEQARNGPPGVGMVEGEK